MDKAAERLALAVEHEENFAVFGDYDVDGATSSAVLSRYFAALGRPVRVYIPDRQREGYGPNTEAFKQLQAEGQRAQKWWKAALYAKGLFWVWEFILVNPPKLLIVKRAR